MADLSKITCIEDLRVIAERRVPRMFYDYADSGSYTQGTYRDNEAAFQKIKLRQRVAVNMEGRSTRSTMVGQDVAMPVAIAPTGLTGMQHADGEILAAKAAKASSTARKSDRIANFCPATSTVVGNSQALMPVGQGQGPYRYCYRWQCTFPSVSGWPSWHRPQHLQ